MVLLPPRPLRTIPSSVPPPYEEGCHHPCRYTRSEGAGVRCELAQGSHNPLKNSSGVEGKTPWVSPCTHSECTQPGSPAHREKPSPACLPVRRPAHLQRTSWGQSPDRDHGTLGAQAAGISEWDEDILSGAWALLRWGWGLCLRGSVMGSGTGEHRASYGTAAVC